MVMRDHAPNAWSLVGHALPFIVMRHHALPRMTMHCHAWSVPSEISKQPNDHAWSFIIPRQNPPSSLWNSLSPDFAMRCPYVAHALPTHNHALPTANLLIKSVVSFLVIINTSIIFYTAWCYNTNFAAPNNSFVILQCWFWACLCLDRVCEVAIYE